MQPVRGVLIAVLGAAALAAAPAADAATSFVVTGRGFGHGIGMSQYGAYGYAQHGWTAAKILRHYYRGTTIGTVPSQPVRVLLADGRASLQVASGQPISVADSAGQWEVLPAGTYTLRAPLSLPGWPAQTPPMPPVSLDAGAAQLTVDGKPYRGSLSVGATGGRLSVVNTVPLESYLLGVVPREMPASWAPEALRAQAIAARSYALGSLHPDSAFDVYADTRSQVYGGAGGEDARSTAGRAVDGRAGRPLARPGGGDLLPLELRRADRNRHRRLARRAAAARTSSRSPTRTTRSRPTTPGPRWRSRPWARRASSAFRGSGT